MKQYLILGAGISGCTAAWELARQGHEVMLLESANVVGGAPLDYTCKATDECSRCGVCVAHTQIAQALAHPNITASVGVRLQEVSYRDTQLHVAAQRKNPAIDLHACTGCDACVHACPNQCIQKRQQAELTQYVIDYTACRLHQGARCTACAEACPVQAIDAQAAVTDLTVNADAALLATGHAPYDASHKVRYGYGRIPHVMTGVEAETLLSHQNSLGNASERIAFIQCVGSRDPQIGRNYCSGVCCAYALRLARVIKHRTPETEVTIYYIDLQNFDKTFTLFKQAVEAEGVRLVRGLPFSVESSPTTQGVKLLIENDNGDITVAEHDRVVLSVGMGPAANAGRIAALFGLNQDEFGFYSSNNANVFVSGTCREPLSISDSMSAARAVAFDMMRLDESPEATIDKSLLKQASSQTRSTESQKFETREIPLQQHVLVIGGGLAGISTAKELAALGYGVTLVEQQDELGGRLRHADPIHDALCVEEWPISMDIIVGVKVLTHSRVMDIQGQVGNFTATLNTPDGSTRLDCGAIVLATGEDAPQPVSRSPYIFPFKDIQLAFADLVKRPGMRTLGIVLDMQRDEGTASTEIALKLALMIQQMKRYQAYLFCRHLRVAVQGLEQVYDQAREAGANIIKYEGELKFEDTPAGVQIRCQDAILGRQITLYCDRVGISQAGMLTTADQALAECSRLDLDAYGHVQRNNIHLFPTCSNRPGIFTVGACRGEDAVPRLLDEAAATALEVHALLAPRTLTVELSHASVDADKCVLCLTCIRSCPHHAMRIDREAGSAASLPEVCQQCGICVAECPAKAITLPKYAQFTTGA